VLRLPTKIHRTGKHSRPDTENINKQLNIMIAIQANHTLNTGHKYGTIIDTKDIIRTHRKGKHLYALEKYHIYKISNSNFQMNDSNIDTYNRIFRAVWEMNRVSSIYALHPI
jgi:hypothetical protein